jgi:hypothetical protein
MEKYASNIIYQIVNQIHFLYNINNYIFNKNLKDILLKISI